ncbi:MAG: pyridoxal phosphate-dependent aminotransferase [Endomicrobium sp.]|jgi:aspartate aminotransferase|nr:pyridoxal phosphate-dependent aminotransferase [Endomicrobium sp.]
MQISDKLLAVKPSATLYIDAKVKILKQQGIDVINFGVGEPDFDTPINIKEAAIKAIKDGFTKYCPVAGTLELKEAIINKLYKDNNIAYKLDEIIVSNGAKHSLYNALQSILNNGDEVIIPAPYWVSYTDMVFLAGGIPVIVNTSDNNSFKITPTLLTQACTKKTKVLIINAPSNPTGVMYTIDELKEIMEICRQYNIFVITDDIYEKFVYNNRSFVSIASVFPKDEIKERVLIINGVSKAYAMTGWRIGYAAGHNKIIAAMSTLQSQSTSNASSISMKAAVEALNGTQEYLLYMKQIFEERRNYIVENLNTIQGITCKKPHGSFYVFPNISNIIGKTLHGGKVINSDIDFANYLLDKARVAVVPGSAFGCEDYIRISYATSMSNIKDGLNRLKSLLL